jgi:hypothetical protein
VLIVLECLFVQYSQMSGAGCHFSPQIARRSHSYLYSNRKAPFNPSVQPRHQLNKSRSSPDDVP